MINYPAIFSKVAANAACTALLGKNPTRFWAYGMAPEDETRPYVVHQLVSGQPINHLSCRPSADEQTLQVQCYAKTDKTCRQVLQAVADVVEQMGYITGWINDGIDKDTRLFSRGFFADFITPR